MAGSRLTAALARMAALTNRERGARPAGWSVSTAPIAQILAHLDDPHTRFAAVHVAGSKGKGSVAVRTALLARRERARVGLYTSPHVHRLNERVSVDAEPIGNDALASALHASMDARDELARAQPSCPAAFASWFDVLTAAAFCAFAEARVDLAVVECGLGGARDSTNVLRAPVCVLTNVLLEHTAQLGASRAEIAREKAGIVSPGASLVVGMPPGWARTDEAGVAALDEARRRGADRVLFALPPEHAQGASADAVEAATAELSSAALAELRRRGLLPPRRGEQLGLAGPADARAERGALDASGLAHAERAAAATLLPARMERVRTRDGVRVLLDGAHVPESVAHAARALGAEPPRAAEATRGSEGAGGGACLRDGGEPAAPSGGAVVVLGVAADKDAAGIVRALEHARGDSGGVLVATRLPASADVPSVCPDELLKLARAQGWHTCEIVDDAEDAVARALAIAAEQRPARRVLVTGSLKLGGAARVAITNHDHAAAPSAACGPPAGD